MPTNQTTTPLTDGGYVVAYEEQLPNSSPWNFFAQKYSSSGQSVGPQLTDGSNTNLYMIAPLSGGGYVALVESFSQSATEGTADVVDTTGKLLNRDQIYPGQNFRVTAGPSGGFIVSGVLSPFATPYPSASQPELQAFDKASGLGANSGQVRCLIQAR